MNPAGKETAGGEVAPAAPGDLRLRESQAKPLMTTRNAWNSLVGKWRKTIGGEIHARYSYRESPE